MNRQLPTGGGSLLYYGHILHILYHVMCMYNEHIHVGTDITSRFILQLCIMPEVQVVRVDVVDTIGLGAASQRGCISSRFRLKLSEAHHILGLVVWQVSLSMWFLGCISHGTERRAFAQEKQPMRMGDGD